MAVGTQQQTGQTQGGRGVQGGSEGLYDQAREAVSGVADRASEMWDGAADQGARYYRNTTRAVSNADASTWGVILLIAAAGYGIAWLAHGQQWSQADYRTRGRGRYADRSPDRY